MLNPNTTAFVFPGQGSQSIGMGYDLALNYPSAKKIFTTADKILGVNLSSICWEGPKDKLDDTYNTQPALYTCSIAGLTALRETLGEFIPAFAAGHSLGEISALAAMGAMSFEDGLKLVRERGRLMKLAGTNNPGGMAAILRMDSLKLMQICEQASEETGLYVQVANDNCPGQLVISGDNVALDRAIDLVVNNDSCKAIRLPISIAAHSPLMSHVSDDYNNTVNSILFGRPNTKIIGNVGVTNIDTPDKIKKELGDQLTSPVRWRETIEYLLGKGVDNFVEIGTGKVLTGLLRRIDRKAYGHVIDDKNALIKIASA
ncbi:MAG: ACP S-malonyltransferase [Anaerolineales bacterium]